MSRIRPDLGFIADMMLGRLARWMRIFGYDVSYQDPVDDAALLKRARLEFRVLLTRDTRLVKRRDAGEHLLIRNNDPMAQLQEVIQVYPPDPSRMLSRCIRCNRLLVPVTREEARDQVPEYIFLTESKFAGCPECGRIYWQGTHARHMADACKRITEKRR